MALITISDVQKIRKISQTFKTERFDTFAQSAQDENLREWLGDSLYLDLVTNPTSAKYVTLLDGENYTLNGKTVKFFGLKVYLSYAWLAINADEGDDFQSNVGTINFNQSDTVRVPVKKTKKYQSAQIIYKNNAIDYLNEKNDIYPLWESTVAKDNRGKMDFMIM